jgi:hypothetical protein
MTSDVIVQWLHHFSKHTVAGNPLITFDGSSSHLDAKTVRPAESHGITPVCRVTQLTTSSLLTSRHSELLNRILMKIFNCFGAEILK